MSKIKCGIDLDGTISTAYCWLPLFNFVANTNLQESDITDYDIHKSFGIDNLWEIIMDEHCEEYFDDVDIRPCASEVINKLIELNVVEPYLITARDNALYKRTRTTQYLMAHDLGSLVSNLSMLGSHNKLQVAQDLNLQVMIEDNPNTAIQFAKEGITVLLLDTNYNKDVEHGNIYRCKDWLDVFRIMIELESRL